MNDIPTPVLIGVGVAVVLLLLAIDHSGGSGTGAPITTVGTDPGAVSLAEAQTAASAQAFGDLASVIHDVSIAQISAQVQNHATDVQGATAQYVAGQQASAAQALANVQAQLELERLGIQSQENQSQVDAQNHASNLQFWGALLGQYGETLVNWALGKRSGGSAFGGYSGPSFGGYSGGYYA